MRGCLYVVTALVVGAALALGGIYYFLVQPAPTRVAATPIPTSVAAVQSFDRKVNTVVSAPANAPITVELTDAELTSKFAQTIREQRAAIGADVQNPQVAVRGGKVYIGGDAQPDGFPVRVNLTIIAVPQAVNGRLVLRVEKVESGRVPLPDSLTKQIIDVIQDDKMLNDNLPITVDRVDAQDGKLVLTGKRK